MKKIIQFNKIESTACFNLHGNYVIVCFFPPGLLYSADGTSKNDSGVTTTLKLILNTCLIKRLILLIIIHSEEDLKLITYIKQNFFQFRL